MFKLFLLNSIINYLHSLHSQIQSKNLYIHPFHSNKMINQSIKKESRNQKSKGWSISILCSFIHHRCRSHPKDRLFVSWFCKIHQSWAFHLHLCQLIRAFPSILNLGFSHRLRSQFSSNSWKWSCWGYLHQRAWKFCRFRLLSL